MRNTISFLIITTIIMSQFCGCKKDDAANPITTSYSIEGLWKGTLTIDGQPSVIGEMNLSIKQDGTLVNDSKLDPQQHFSRGSWTLTDDTAFVATVTCVYGYPSNIGIMQRFTAKFNKGNGALSSGVWTNLPPASGSGTFSLTEVN